MPFGDGSLYQGGGKKGLNPECILKIELTGFANEFGMEFEKEKLRMTFFFFFGLSNRKPFTDMGNHRMIKFVGAK